MRTVHARPASAWLTCKHGLTGAGRRPTHAADQPARSARVQHLNALESERERARLTRRPVVRAPHPTMERPATSGYGMSHVKVFTMSTQGTRRTRLTWLGGPTRS
jgi:hypothetical protein